METKRTLRRIAPVLAALSAVSAHGLVAQAAQDPSPDSIRQVVQRDRAPDRILETSAETIFRILGNLAALPPDSSAAGDMAQQDSQSNPNMVPTTCIDQVIDAQATLQYEAACVGEGPAYLWVSGKDEAELDIRVYDGNGRLVASAEDMGDSRVVSWSPQGKAPYQVTIRNLGDVHSVLTICTN